MKNTINTKIIDIEYEEKDYLEAKKISEDITRNYLFFQKLVEPFKTISFINTPNTIQVTSYEDFKNYIKSRLQDIISDIKISKENNEVIYLKFILLNKIDALINHSPQLATLEELYAYINLIYSILAVDYYEDIDDYLEFISKLPEAEEEKLIKKLYAKNTFELLNHLLEEQYELIVHTQEENGEYDSFLKNNMEEMLLISQLDCMQEQTLSYDEEDLPKLNKEDLEELVREFLRKIDPSLKWLNIYNEALKENRIIYGTIPNNNNGWSCIPYNGRRCIVAPLSGNIRDFRRMIHELVHYISTLDLPLDKITPPALDEYPSIVFETIAIEYLKIKGYDEKTIQILLQERISRTQDNISDIVPTLELLTEFINEGPITLESEKKKARELQTFLSDNKIQEPVDEEKILDKIDCEIIYMLTEPLTLLEEYPYVLGRYLSIKTVEKILENPTLILRIIEITENLYSETPQTVIRKMNLSDDLLKENKQYKKRHETI